MSTFVTVRNRGQISLPVAIRKRFRLDEPGVQLEIVVRDNEIVLRPKIATDPNQAWFWTEEWQVGERRVDAEIAAGNFTVHKSGREFLDSLNSDE